MNSEQTKASIEAHRNQISEAESKIAGLHRQLRNRHYSGINGRPRVNTEEVYKEISRLEDSIKILEQRIKFMEGNLPLLITSEKAAAEIERQTAEQQRQKAAADRAAHDQAVKQKALEQWLQVPGQSAQGFEVAWPTIAGQIALNRAVAAGSAESERPHDHPLREIALNTLAISYGKKESEQ